MIEDFFTKLLQGTFFQIYIEIIIRRKHISNIGQLIYASTKQRVDSPGDVEIDKET